MIWFTADLHFNHKNIIKYCNRPFNSVEEMNKTLIDNWNKRVSRDDLVYVLGDFCFGNSDYYLKQLNGSKILIFGNHDDTNIRKNKGLFRAVYDILKIKERGKTIMLCHYAMRVWAKSHFNSYHLYGHSHGTLPPVGKSLDVGVDCHSYSPISIDQVINLLECAPNNQDLVKRKY